jgi:hypothetical protein
VVVRDTLGEEADGLFGNGLAAQEGARAEVSRALFERNRLDGVQALDGAYVSLTDVAVRDTQNGFMGAVPDVDPHDPRLYRGRGLLVEGGSRADVSRAVFERNMESGVVAMGDETDLALSDVVVRDTRCRESDGMLGEGLVALYGARAVVDRAVFESNRTTNVASISPGTTIQMTDVVVRDAFEFIDGFGGTGIAAFGEAHVDATRFLVTGSALCGVQLVLGGAVDEDGDVVPYDDGGTMDLHEGEISGNAVCGINVQTEDFDVNRLIDRVVFRDNGVNLDMSDDIYVPTIDLSETLPHEAE